jgi:polar amino acid transport system permease protein
MKHKLLFQPVVASGDILINGAILTIELSIAAILLGFCCATLLTALRSLGGRMVDRAVSVYVELMRNTPFLIQLFMIFYGLPIWGIKLSGPMSALLAMTLNLTAYATEILRAGVESIHKSQLEAGLSLAMTRGQIFRHVVIMPAIGRVWPALSSQFVLMLLASSICAFIAVPELSGAAQLVEQRTYRSFEVYILVTAAYLALALFLKLFLNVLGRWLFPRVSGVDRLIAKGEAA